MHIIFVFIKLNQTTEAPKLFTMKSKKKKKKILVNAIKSYHKKK